MWKYSFNMDVRQGPCSEKSEKKANMSKSIDPLLCETTNLSVLINKSA